MLATAENKILKLDDGRFLELPASPPPRIPALWFTGSDVEKDANERVHTWINKGSLGSGFNATQGIQSLKPLWVDNYTNGNPALYFNNNFLEIPQINTLNSSSLTIFFVVSGDAPTSNQFQGYFHVTGGSVPNNEINFWVRRGSHETLLAAAAIQTANNSTVIGTGLNTVPPRESFPTRTTSVRKKYQGAGQALEIYLDGDLKSLNSSNTATGGFTNNRIVIGFQSNYLLGHISEMILYLDALSDENMVSIHNYLDNKYAL